jgi:hypothetical protein
MVLSALALSGVRECAIPLVLAGAPDPQVRPDGRPQLRKRLAGRPRKIAFSGYDWAVKASGAPVGPGPNRFSDSDENVFVDKQGRLHLRITQDEGRWRCAEVVSTRSFGLGTYQFTIDSGIDDMDPNVVLGLFTWSDARAYHHRELDVEISRWGDPANANAQFVVQPYRRKENTVRFSLLPGQGPTSHAFTWTLDRVVFQSWAGAGHTQPADSTRLHQHTFTQGIPKPGGENARMNLWLVEGKPPRNGKAVEVACGRFAFKPLGS